MTCPAKPLLTLQRASAFGFLLGAFMSLGSWGRLLNTTPGDYKRSLQDIEYRGEEPVSVKILNSDAAACQFVFIAPLAIAIIETDSMALPACGAVRVLRFDGKLPGDKGDRLK
jgi:hypothetical protein